MKHMYRLLTAILIMGGAMAGKAQTPLSTDPDST